MSRLLSDITITSWNQLIEKLHAINVVQLRPDEGDHRRSPYVFRGVDSADWELQTSLQRLSKSPGTNTALIERSLIRSFRKYANAGAFDEKSEWYVLAVAQHNGLPTRCLDWTASPLVAAHFACGDEAQKHVDAAIWCLHAGQLRNINSASNANAASLTGIAWVYDTRLLEQSYQNLAVLDQTLDKSKGNGEMLLLWEPPSLDLRIASQTGLMSIMNDPEESQDQFLKLHAAHHPDLMFRIVIAASAKSEIRDMLDQNGISERSIYPGLPGLCSWLKRYYGKAW